MIKAAIDLAAAAYASAGQFDKAVTAQQEAISLAKPTKKKEFQERLDLYMAKIPYRREGSQSNRPLCE